MIAGAQSCRRCLAAFGDDVLQPTLVCEPSHSFRWFWIEYRFLSFRSYGLQLHCSGNSFGYGKQERDLFPPERDRYRNG